MTLLTGSKHSDDFKRTHSSFLNIAPEPKRNYMKHWIDIFWCLKMTLYQSLEELCLLIILCHLWMSEMPWAFSNLIFEWLTGSHMNTVLSAKGRTVQLISHEVLLYFLLVCAFLMCLKWEGLHWKKGMSFTSTCHSRFSNLRIRIQNHSHITDEADKLSFLVSRWRCC